MITYIEICVHWALQFLTNLKSFNLKQKQLYLIPVISL